MAARGVAAKAIGSRLAGLEHRAAALANMSRVQVLYWLREPRRNFPPQVHADIEEAGVCGVFIAEKLGISQATASQHLKILHDAGFVSKRRIGKWTYFKLEGDGLARLSADLEMLGK